MARAASRQLIPSTSSTDTATATATATATTITTLETTSSCNQQQPLPITETLVLKLKPPKKKVSWKEGTVDNEFMNKKRSKKCCIFHKEKPFDEDDSDEDDYHKHSHDAGDRNCCHGHGEDTTVQ
ncbi:protein phosphatase 1 regulatory subunit INH3 [Olea europaea var. sylvestris]|uniref:protein phosphatase 1 regulatory subunit INH3 n=1 Tax=Olea europaea var. sylvestris TaxID=158386 RepID=UPI000C1CD36B|nr:protein phosphatase 1 regulatory subunit INH3 [Olea europaea var. sylvestris]